MKMRTSRLTAFPNRSSSRFAEPSNCWATKRPRRSLENSRRDKKTVRRDETFANDLTVECLRYMYRILFLLFVEARPDLAYAPTENDAFQSGYSFEDLRDRNRSPC